MSARDERYDPPGQTPVRRVRRERAGEAQVAYDRLYGYGVGAETDEAWCGRCLETHEPPECGGG